MATELQKPLSNAFVKNRYIYRTFIVSCAPQIARPTHSSTNGTQVPGQKARQKSVRRKLSPIASEFKGKVVCLVDDSIVRGTTSREIVRGLIHESSNQLLTLTRSKWSRSARPSVSSLCRAAPRSHTLTS